MHSRPQSPRSFWPAAGYRELWEQPIQACAIEGDCVKPDGQNSVISFVISKWLLPLTAGQRERRLWERDCCNVLVMCWQCKQARDMFAY